MLGVALYAAAGVIGWVYAPKLALMIFLALPIFYGITSEGLTETRVRICSEGLRASLNKKINAYGTEVVPKRSSIS